MNITIHCDFKVYLNVPFQNDARSNREKERQKEGQIKRRQPMTNREFSEEEEELAKEIVRHDEKRHLCEMEKQREREKKRKELLLGKREI